MKKINIIFLILSFFTIGCDSVIPDADLEYVEKIIINGRITAGEKIDNISIRRTLPPDEVWKEENSFIEDAEVVIGCDNTEYKLEHIKNGLYSCGLIPEAEKVYHLSVKWKNKHCFATTVIPENFDIHSSFLRKEIINEYLRIESTNYYLKLPPIKNAVYIASYKTNWQDRMIRYYGKKPKSADEVSEDGFVELFVKPLDNYYPENIIQSIVEAYDEKFKDIVETLGNSTDDSYMFSTSGYQVRWNIKGDGIGMFIGINKRYFESEIDTLVNKN